MKIKICTVILFAILVLLQATRLSAQVLPDSLVKKIDAVFTRGDNINSPGYAVGIVRNDSLIFAKGYGMANLEYAIPNTPQSIFQMASISKQFTAYAIVLLAKEGRLQLDDDIRKYLTWFPDLHKKITIRNLLNHTSGIRDILQLLELSGTRLEDVITQDQVIKILRNQRTLNFEPGEQYCYSSSGYILLAEIVQNVSGKSFREFCDSTIFKPLGMNNTHICDDYTEIIKNRAYSYHRTDNIHYSNSILNYSYYGPTNLYTNVIDMSKWIMNFFDPKVGNKNDIARLTKRGKLNNGKEIDYAFGIVPAEYKGWKQFLHGGVDAGYRTFVTVFPDLKLGFILFSNADDLNPWNVFYQFFGNYFIKDKTKQKTTIVSNTQDSSATLIRNEKSLEDYLGDYISEYGKTLNLNIKRARLYYRINDGQEKLLKRESDNTFSDFNESYNRLLFKIQSNDTTVDMLTPFENDYYKKYTKNELVKDNVLQTYTGLYYCPELDCKYGIILRDHHLFLTNAKYNDIPLIYLTSEHLRSNFWGMDHLLIKRNNSNQIIGFEVNDERIKHLRFDKIK